MNKYLKKLLLFLLPIVLLIVPVDLVISHFLKQSTEKHHGEFEVWNDIYNSNIDADIAIYGSSRAWVHMSPEILESELHKPVYNFGVDGHNFRVQYLRHLEYTKHNNKPDYVIMSVGKPTFEQREDLYNLEQFLPYMLWNENMEEYLLAYQGFDKLDFILPVLRYFGETKVIITSVLNIIKGNQPFRNKGYRSEDLKWTDDLAVAKKQKESISINFNDESIALFKKFLKECKADNIKVFLVYTPEFVEGQQYISNREDLVVMLNKISSDYNIPFLDYSDLELTKNKDYFYNSMHMNKKGAEKFSYILGEDLKKYIN